MDLDILRWLIGICVVIVGVLVLLWLLEVLRNRKENPWDKPGKPEKPSKGGKGPITLAQFDAKLAPIQKIEDLVRKMDAIGQSVQKIAAGVARIEEELVKQGKNTSIGQEEHQTSGAGRSGSGAQSKQSSTTPPQPTVVQQPDAQPKPDTTPTPPATPPKSAPQLIVERYNQDAPNLRAFYDFKEFTVGNMQAMGKHHAVDPQFRVVTSQEQGEYLMVETPGESYGLVVPKHKPVYNAGQLTSGAFEQVFECQGYQPGKRYRKLELIEPARFKEQGGNFEQVSKGVLRLSADEPDM